MFGTAAPRRSCRDIGRCRGGGGGVCKGERGDSGGDQRGVGSLRRLRDLGHGPWRGPGESVYASSGGAEAVPDPAFGGPAPVVRGEAAGSVVVGAGVPPAVRGDGGSGDGRKAQGGP